MMNKRIFNIRALHSYAIVALLFIVAFSSCNDSNSPDETREEAAVSFQLRAASEDYLNNTSIYRFDTSNKFVEKMLNVQRENNTLSTYTAVGTWNLVLLTCNENISDNIIVPSPKASYTEPMWRTKDVGNFLSQTPELRYVSLPNVVITKDNVTKLSTLLYRNVAKIQVILKKYDGFDKIKEGKNTNAYAELLDVPTTLNWDGNLYPNKTSPDLSEKPLREDFKFNNSGVADTVNFIVPAHRGDDAFKIDEDGILVQNSATVDTTTHKLKLRVSMPLSGQAYFGKSKEGIEIPYVPKVNSIIQVNVTFYGKTSMDIKIDVKPWEDWIIQEETFE
ncbi:FimB/Mfa2 family fimbrial subunit [Limibacterium fermenti]|uniref:FimB/Mfa2 family fimbrial subunit n=1 Tax=Limibacterium fermenti TaxID=3229863 RepID=UPI000E85E68A|nr:hypothetical protein [Porphyromonadaceae bacterium]